MFDCFVLFIDASLDMLRKNHNKHMKDREQRGLTRVHDNKNLSRSYLSVG